MCRVKHYLRKFSKRIRKIFSNDRVKKYGIKLALLDFLIFLMHRKGSKLEHWLIRKKDIIVQEYIYKNYPDIINEAK